MTSFAGKLQTFAGNPSPWRNAGCEPMERMPINVKRKSSMKGRLGQIARSLGVMVLAGALSACSFTDTDEYNACVTAWGLTGLGVGLLSSGAGSVIAGAAGGAGLAVALCDESPQMPGQQKAADRAAIDSMAARIEPQPLGDEDGDGVRDDRDKCPGTRSGVEVDYRGCAKPLVFDSRVLNFAFDSAKLAPNAADVLEPVLKALARYPNARFEIAGHTDSKGTNAYNQSLSERRAAAVVAQLVAMGVDAERLESKGYGESEPASSNETDNGRAKNRRVEIRLIDN